MVILKKKLFVQRASDFRKKLLNLIEAKFSSFENIILANWSLFSDESLPTSLQVYLSAMRDLVELRVTHSWNWDFFINLNEEFKLMK